MKKSNFKLKNLLFIPVLAIFLSVACLVGCGDDEGQSPSVSAVLIDIEKEKEIKSAYAQLNNVPVSTVSLNCFGVFDNSYALMLDSTEFSYSQAIEYDNFGAVIFTYSGGNKMQVYSGGNFYSLNNACQNGLLTKNNLREIAELIPNTPSVIGLWANYGDYIALSIGINGTEPYKDVVETISVDGTLFDSEINKVDRIVFVNPYGIQLYKDGEFYSLKFAVESKLISLDDYVQISEINGFYWK